MHNANGIIINECQIWRKNYENVYHEIFANHRVLLMIFVKYILCASIIITPVCSLHEDPTFSMVSYYLDNAPSASEPHTVIILAKIILRCTFLRRHAFICLLDLRSILDRYRARATTYTGLEMD